MRTGATLLILLAMPNASFGDVAADVKEALAGRAARVAKAQAEFDKQIALATRLAVDKLEKLAIAATRKGDPAGAGLAWKQVLSLDSTRQTPKLAATSRLLESLPTS